MSDNRPPRYEEDGRIIYRASSLGMCDKVFVALANGYSPKAHPAWFQAILDEGTENEAVIRGMYHSDTGTEVVDVGRIVEMEILDGVWVRGSIDGTVAQLDVNHVSTLFEAKKIRDSGWAKFLRSGVEVLPTYPMQTAFYMHALEDETGMPWDMHFVGGHYVQDEKTDEWSITEIFIHTYTMPPVPLLAIKKRIAKLERLITETQAIGDMACNVAMFPCPFYYLHDDTMDETPVRPADDIVQDNLAKWDTLEQERVGLAPRLKAITDQQETVKAGVMAWLQAGGQDSGDVSTVVVGNTEIAVKYLVSPRAGYTVGSGEQTRVTIKVVKRGNDTVAKAPAKSRVRKPATPKPDNPLVDPSPALPGPGSGRRKLADRPQA